MNRSPLKLICKNLVAYLSSFCLIEGAVSAEYPAPMYYSMAYSDGLHLYSDPVTDCTILLSYSSASYSGATFAGIELRASGPRNTYTYDCLLTYPNSGTRVLFANSSSNP